MRALRFHGPGDLRLESVPEPEAGAGETVVEVDACGVCGSDLHFLDGTARTARLPMTLGHEVAGRVLGENTAGLSAGARVVLRPGAYCGRCRPCLEGRPNICERAVVLGIDSDGGLAERVVVPVESIIPMPDGLDPAEAATAVDAGATARHAVMRTGGVRAGDAVLILGVGGLGGYAVQIARNAGAGPVIAADISPSALDRATQLGADETILVEPGVSLGRQVKMITDGGADVALEFVGRAATVDAAVKSLRPGGRAVVVGVGVEPVATLPAVLWSNNEYTLAGSYGSLPGDVELVLAALATGDLIPPQVERVPLDEAVSVIEAASRGDLHLDGRRLVVVP